VFSPMRRLSRFSPISAPPDGYVARSQGHDPERPAGATLRRPSPTTSGRRTSRPRASSSRATGGVSRRPHVHIVVVDPGVGSSARRAGRVGRRPPLVAPDNGVLSPAADHARRAGGVAAVPPGAGVDLPRRDVFAPAAARPWRRARRLERSARHLPHRSSAARPSPPTPTMGDTPARSSRSIASATPSPTCPAAARFGVWVGAMYLPLNQTYDRRGASEPVRSQGSRRPGRGGGARGLRGHSDSGSRAHRDRAAPVGTRRDSGPLTAFARRARGARWPATARVARGGRGPSSSAASRELSAES